MKLPKLSSEGGALPLVILLSALAFLVFLLITNTFEFKDKLFSALYPKPTPLAQEKKPPAVPDQILVKFKPGVDEKDKDDELKKHGLEKKDEIKGIGVHIAKVNPNAKEKVLEALKKNKKVEFAEEDFILEELDIPDDPGYITAHWNLKIYNASGAWDITKGDPNIVVAVIDSGVLETHEDLTGKFTAYRYNFVDKNTDITDVTGHGTAVMGLVAATTNNAKGVASLGRNVSIMPLRVVTPAGGVDSSKVAQAIIDAADYGAKVINISLGGKGKNPIEQEAINYAWGKGVVLAAAAGNDGTCCIYYPAASENVIAVGGTDANDNKANFSSTGPGLDVVAPGVNVYTTTRLGSYGGFSGTSSSTPQVSALASLIFSAKPTLSNQQVVDIITSTAKDLGAVGWDDQFGFGRIDAGAAVQKATGTPPPPPDTQAPTVSITAPLGGSTVSGLVDVSANATDNVAVSKVDFYVDGALLASDTATPYLSLWDTTKYKNGSHTVFAKAYDAAGNMTQSATVTVSVNNAAPTPTPAPNPTQTPAPVQALDTTAPTVTLSSPDNGSYVKQVSGRTIKANASDDVAVSKVEFYVDGALLTTDVISPYEVSWNTTSLATGSTHTIYTIAYDSSLNKKQSNTNTVTIDGVKPTVSLTAPSAGALVTAGSSLALAANASDNFVVSKVTFTISGGSLDKPITLKDTTSPYTATWTVPTGVGITYTIKAQAEDKAGNDSTTSQVNVTSN